MQYKYEQKSVNGKNDAYHVYSGDSVIGCTITDYSAKKLHHYDAIQLMTSKYWTRYTGDGHNKGCVIKDNIIDGINIQGICGFDGRYSNVTICNNTIKTKSPHQITINGLTNGTIDCNRDDQGNPIFAVLNPLRLMGNNGVIQPIHILEAKNMVLYSTVEGDVIDNRTLPQASGINLIAFDYDLYLYYLPSIRMYTKEFYYLQDCHKWAQECGIPV